MEYTIVSDYNVQELIKQVKLLINQGWEPLGGICVCGYTTKLLQAMIKRL